jgi:hypothetical protein
MREIRTVLDGLILADVGSEVGAAAAACLMRVAGKVLRHLVGI